MLCIVPGLATIVAFALDRLTLITRRPAPELQSLVVLAPVAHRVCVIHWRHSSMRQVALRSSLLQGTPESSKYHRNMITRSSSHLFFLAAHALRSALAWARVRRPAASIE